MELTDRRATIIGLGREGTALAKFLAQRGAIVTVSDLKPPEELRDNMAELKDLPIRFVLGEHPAEVLETDVLFVSPGVPLEAPIVAAARERNIPISSETKLFFQLCPAPIIGITGSNGKTTTTTLVGEMLKAAGHKTYVGGNIGQPLIGRLDEMDPSDRVVMELSSFQLELIESSPHIAAILNVTPDHLDRHPSLASYLEAKKNIILHQTAEDFALLSYDNQITRQLKDECRGRVLLFSQTMEPEEGAFRRDGQVMVRFEDTERRICDVKEIRLLGPHNVDNVLASVALASIVGVPPETMATVVASFAGIEHNLELVREIRGVRYYDDSSATSPQRTIAALRSFAEPIVLLAGGRHKNLPLEQLAQLAVEKVKHLILFGEAAPLLAEAVKGYRSEVKSPLTSPEIYRCATLEGALETAAQVAQPGDVVLLSPACASFDMFRDFAERGERFKELVNNLPE